MGTRYICDVCGKEYDVKGSQVQQEYMPKECLKVSLSALKPVLKGLLMSLRSARG